MTFSGIVIHGSKHGRTIGYPTVNLEIADSIKSALPAYGVYAVGAVVRGREYAGALFWGKRTLFRDRGDVYGEEVSVEVITHIRDVVVVNDSRELKELISQDIQNVKKAYDLSRS
ncbi:MAG: riboflavin kinase [Parcubacteria group bacterium]|nr:riboflavin kinase [Parcubacteria group bacterium]